LPGLGKGKITASCQDCGISVIAKIAVYLLFSRLYSKLRRRNNTAWLLQKPNSSIYGSIYEHLKALS